MATKIKIICLLSQASAACKIKPQLLEDAITNIGPMSMVETRTCLKHLSSSIRADIKAHRGELEDDGPETIPYMQKQAGALDQIAKWMKENNFTHFIPDVDYFDITDSVG